MSARNQSNGTGFRVGPSWPNMLRASKRARIRVEGELRSREYETDAGVKGPHLRDRRLVDRELTSRSTDLDLGVRVGSRQRFCGRCSLIAEQEGGADRPLSIRRGLSFTAESDSVIEHKIAPTDHKRHRFRSHVVVTYIGN